MKSASILAQITLMGTKLIIIELNGVHIHSVSYS